MAGARKPFHPLRVASVERLCADAAAVTFAVPDELRAEFDFRPGQSVTLRKKVAGAEQRRSYSICAPAGAAPRIGVRVVPGGAFSGWLVNEVRPGDEIEVQPPTGRFALDPGTGGWHVLFAAGSGITPMLSIAATVLRDPEARVTLFYGNRRVGSVMFTEELGDLKDRYGGRLQLTHVLSREPRSAELLSGRLDAERIRRLLRAFVPVAAVDHFWLCGPIGMVVDVRDALYELGVGAERIHEELFFVEDSAPRPVRHADLATTGPTSEVTIVLDGNSSTATLSRAESVLDGAQAARADLPFACKGGVCGTCRAKVTAGEVRMHRNYALEDFEVAAGFVLTCQSFPISDTVTVDFDA
ncbi:1,2-phenylacetyl-CoA epoxidase subunit PaaE [Nocardia pseudobrasiliensis]|uniref:Ring-1,2-phenylacetyl-CoA epoxidase subunit PaaE n=1 Tax=Nocardia pseudobrasiliensis TaxID=45979 RepID=A0A370IF39_9NOCA|nr:1,2-phenylacetyl-CoA epoxidase subunit PaaE [Nocardia pseudobrasiliensis]RDI68064.1 ring-1,2-phenylacetyl-CoA epoxidase subunit PaaE [Nocardia pseudobrasiliensis]